MKKKVVIKKKKDDDADDDDNINKQYEDDIMVGRQVYHTLTPLRG